MSQNRRNTNPIGFVSDERQLSKNRQAAYNGGYPHPVPLGYIPPFQLVRLPAESSLVAVNLYTSDGASVFNITSDMLSTGFQVFDYTTYKIWVYPGVLPLTSATFEQGVYYMKLTDSSGGVLWREDFAWKEEASMTGFVKVEWFHQRQLDLAFGHLQFTFPFKFWHWFATELGKPSYQYERDVDERNGVEYVNKVVSWKEQRFVTHGDENFIDAMSFLPHMDCVDIDFLGDTISAIKVLITPEWEERGDVALIEVEIRSDQVVVTNGDALPNKVYEVAPGECISVAYTAVARITIGTPEYNGFYYVPSAGGANVPFEDGDLVLVRDNNEIKLYTYQDSPQQYNLQAISVGQTVYSADENEYWFVGSGDDYFDSPEVSSVENGSPTWTVFGESFPNSIVEVWVRDGASVETKVGEGASSQLASGIPFTYINGANSVRLVAKSSSCPSFSTSPWFDFTGVGFEIVGSSNVL